MRTMGLALILLTLATQAVQAQEARPRWAKAGVTYRYGLELGGEFVGWLASAEGGGAVADVVTEKVGSDFLAKKHIGNVKYEEISVTFGTDMSKSLYNWVETGFNQTHNQAGKGRQNGAVLFADFDYKEVSRVEFKEALITEIGLPALDAASKDPALMTIKFRPEVTRRTTQLAGSTAGKPVDPKKQKQWVPSAFRLKIDGLDEPTAKVSKIDAFTIKQQVVEAGVGETRDYEQKTMSVEVPNLVITLAESHAEPLFAWHEDFVVKGNATDDKEKGGSLEYLAADLKTVLFTLTFKNLGIFKISPDKMEAGSEGVRRVKAEMYCEDVRFAYSPAVTFGALQPAFPMTELYASLVRPGVDECVR